MPSSKPLSIEPAADRRADARAGAPSALAGMRFDNSYARLPERFYARLAPSAVKAPSLIQLNAGLARELGLDAEALRGAEGVSVLSGNAVPADARPLAMAYAGHQFGQFVPQLGDGRAILLGELVDARGGRRDVQLKGCGRTPFSRAGDGRSALGPVIREYVLSEAMHALGVPTTRSLAAVGTGEPVFRETPLPGGVLTRIAASHVRVGTFEYFAARRDRDALRHLADYVIRRHCPDARDAPKPYVALYQAVCDAQAALVAGWMHVGFIHGVMNTDNMAVSGETIDYGPCAFVDEYDPATVFSSIDHRGRYAFGNQGAIAQWNLARFGETLLALIDDDADRALADANEVLASFLPSFQRRWLDGMRRKLGLRTAADGDEALARDWLALMQHCRADYTLAFRELCAAAEPDGPAADGGALAARFAGAPGLAEWLARWRRRLAREDGPADERAAGMRAVNPARIPRNHNVERAISAAVRDGNFGEMRGLLDALSAPCEERPEWARYARGPEPHERVAQTFCGT